MAQFNIGNAAQGFVGGVGTGGLWGGLAGAALGGFAGGGKSKSKALSAQQQLALALWQNEQEEKRMKNAHQWEAEDLAKAGFNKALTAAAPTAGSIAGNSGNAGNMLANTANNLQQRYDNKMSRNIQSAKNAMDFFNETQRIRNEFNLGQAKIANTDADTTTKLLNNDIIAKYGSKQAKQNFANSILEGEAIKANTAESTFRKGLLKQDMILRLPEQQMAEDYYKFLKNNPQARNAINAINHVAETGGVIMGTIDKTVRPFAALSAAKNIKRFGNSITKNYNAKGEFTGMRESHKY